MKLNMIVSWCLLFHASEIEPAAPFTGEAFRLKDSAAVSPQRITEAEGRQGPS